MLIVGIDPGLSGACAALQRADRDGPDFVAAAIDLPIAPFGSKNHIDVPKLADWLRMVRPFIVVLERVQAMPSGDGDHRKMGAASSFRFGMAFGQIYGCLCTLDIPTFLIVPRVWKKYYSLEGDKEASRQLAIRMYPEAGDMFLRRKKDHGRAEAILLAKYGDKHVIGIGNQLKLI